MANLIELAKSYVPMLDEVYKLASCTSDLDGAPESMRDALALCCCELADTMLQQDEAVLATKGGAVAGESVDGYSVTYRGSTENGSLQDAADAARLHICRKYLCRPVNLLYTGVQP